MFRVIVSVKKAKEQEIEAMSGESLVAFATRELKRRILDNEYPPGYSALEPELAQELGISRTPLREALIKLEQDGLVEIVPRRGMRVLPISAEGMAKLYTVIAALECLACELVVARKLPRSALQPLIKATKDMERALKEDNLIEWARADGNFHLLLVELADNEFLSSTITRYWDQVYRVRMFTLHLRRRPANSTKEHRAIVEAIIEGDAKKAAELNQAHRTRASQELKDILLRFPMGRL
jgi:DNA-binding GntR family transcriptional regulator